MKNNKKKNSIFDERQQLLIGRAAKISIGISFLYLFIVLIIKFFINENFIFEAIHFFILLIVFPLLFKDWGTIEAPRNPFNITKLLDLKKFKSRFKWYLLDGLSFGSIMSIIQILILIFKEKQEVQFNDLLGPFFGFSIAYIIAITAFTEYKVKKYKKNEEKIKEIEKKETRY